MLEDRTYKLNPEKSDLFFASHIRELRSTQFQCDYAMGVLNDLMFEQDECQSCVYLSSILTGKNQQSFAFYYIRYAFGLPTVERFFIDETENGELDSFFIENNDCDHARQTRTILLKKREI